MLKRFALIGLKRSFHLSLAVAIFTNFLPVPASGSFESKLAVQGIPAEVIFSQRPIQGQTTTAPKAQSSNESQEAPSQASSSNDPEQPSTTTSSSTLSSVQSPGDTSDTRKSEIVVGLFVRAETTLIGTTPETVLLSMQSLSREFGLPGNAEISELGSGYVRFIFDHPEGQGDSQARFRSSLQRAIGLTVHFDYAVEKDPEIPTNDSRIKSTSVQSKPPWNLDRIDQAKTKLDGKYTFETDGSGVEIWIVDSGITPNHVEFKSRIESIVGWDSDFYDCDGHGTHVAATALGTTYGVAKGAILSSIKVLGCDGSGSLSRLVEAIDWIIAHKSGPTVANFSLGALTSNSAVRSAFIRLVNAGVVPIVAAGNEGVNSCYSLPANSRVGEISVGAVDKKDKRPWWSNYGSCTDIYAPGVDITSAWWTGNTANKTISGTSMASPLVAGLAARILQSNPDATPAQVKSILVSKALPFSTGISGDAKYLANMVELPSYSAIPDPEISGSAAVGEKLTLDPGTWPDRPKLTFQWYQKNPVTGGLTAIKKAKKSSYQITTRDSGKVILAKVTATKSGYQTEVTISNEIGPVATSFGSAPSPNLSGTLSVGGILTLNLGKWAPEPDSYEIAWSRLLTDGTLEAIEAIDGSGEVFYSYELQPEDVGERIYVEVTASKANYVTTTRGFTTNVIQGLSPEFEPYVYFMGVPAPGETMTFGAEGDFDLESEYRFQLWVGNVLEDRNLYTEPIEYLVKAADVGKALTFKILGTRTGFTLYEASITTGLVGKLFRNEIPEFLTLSGEASVGQTLSVSAGNWPDKPKLTYQWYWRDPKTDEAIAIKKAKKNKYRLGSADIGKTIWALVTVSKKGYVTVYIVSPEIGPVVR